MFIDSGLIYCLVEICVNFSVYNTQVQAVLLIDE